MVAAGSGITGASAAFSEAAGGTMGAAGEADGFSAAPAGFPGLERGLSRKGGDWGSLLITLADEGCSEWMMFNDDKRRGFRTLAAFFDYLPFVSLTGTQQ
jgi:hypothetical protein